MGMAGRRTGAQTRCSRIPSPSKGAIQHCSQRSHRGIGFHSVQLDGLKKYIIFFPFFWAARGGWDPAIPSAFWVHRTTDRRAPIVPAPVSTRQARSRPECRTATRPSGHTAKPQRRQIVAGPAAQVTAWSPKIHCLWQIRSNHRRNNSGAEVSILLGTNG